VHDEQRRPLLRGQNEPSVFRGAQGPVGHAEDPASDRDLDGQEVDPDGPVGGIEHEQPQTGMALAHGVHHVHVVLHEQEHPALPVAPDLRLVQGHAQPLVVPDDPATLDRQLRPAPRQLEGAGLSRRREVEEEVGLLGGFGSKLSCAQLRGLGPDHAEARRVDLDVREHVRFAPPLERRGPGQGELDEGRCRRDRPKRPAVGARPGFHHVSQGGDVRGLLQTCGVAHEATAISDCLESERFVRSDGPGCHPSRGHPCGRSVRFVDELEVRVERHRSVLEPEPKTSRLRLDGRPDPLSDMALQQLDAALSEG